MFRQHIQLTTARIALASLVIYCKEIAAQHINWGTNFSHSFACQLATTSHWLVLTLFSSSLLCLPSPNSVFPSSNSVSLLPILFSLLPTHVPSFQLCFHCNSSYPPHNRWTGVTQLSQLLCCRPHAVAFTVVATVCMCVCVCLCVSHHFRWDERPRNIARHLSAYRVRQQRQWQWKTPHAHMCWVCECQCVCVCVCQADNLSWVRRNRESRTAVNIHIDATWSARRERQTETETDTETEQLLLLHSPLPHTPLHDRWAD